MQGCRFFFPGCLLLAATFAIGNGRKLPPYIEKCRRSDRGAGLNECLIKRARALLPQLVKGIPELKLPPIEPLHVPKLEIRTGSGGSVGFKAVVTDMAVYGSKATQIRGIELDLEDKHVLLDAFIPALHIEGKYAFEGKILRLDLHGSGDVEIDVADIESKIYINFTTVVKDSMEYIEIGRDYKLNRGFGDVKVYFQNLFENNQQLTEEMNRLINENIEELGKEILPLLDEAIYTLILEIMRPFLENFSIEELFDN